jgi:hypothetical protein
MQGRRSRIQTRQIEAPGLTNKELEIPTNWAKFMERNVQLFGVFFPIQALTQVWCNSKSQKAAKAFGFNKITTGVLLLNNIDSQNPQNVD